MTISVGLKKQMQDKLDKYEAENRLPDEELKAFYEKRKHIIRVLGGIDVYEGTPSAHLLPRS